MAIFNRIIIHRWGTEKFCRYNFSLESPGSTWFAGAPWSDATGRTVSHAPGSIVYKVTVEYRKYSISEDGSNVRATVIE